MPGKTGKYLTQSERHCCCCPGIQSRYQTFKLVPDVPHVIDFVNLIIDDKTVPLRPMAMWEVACNNESCKHFAMPPPEMN